MTNLVPDVDDIPIADRKPGSIWCYAYGTSLQNRKVAREHLAAYYQGLVDLTQRRVPGVPGVFTYWACRRHTTRRPTVPAKIRSLVDKLLLEFEEHADA